MPLKHRSSSWLKQGPLPLDGLEVTHALLLRLSAFYAAQRNVDHFLDKRIRTAAADFFVETLAFYLKALVITHRLNAEVSVERVLQRKRGSIRPDISLWRGDTCVACIECKTQLGWSRDRWEAQFLEREQRLVAEFAGAPTFLVVLTGLNWSGFGEHEDLGQKSTSSSFEMCGRRASTSNSSKVLMFHANRGTVLPSRESPASRSIGS